MSVEIKEIEDIKIVERLLDENRQNDLFILSRFMYRIGAPILDDKVYNPLEDIMKEEGALPEYTSRTYDDDPIPYELLKEFDLMGLVPRMGSESKYAKELDEEKSLSIRAITTYHEAYESFNSLRGEQLIASLKGDGINGKHMYIDDLLEVSLSRGRKTHGFDLTKNICRVIPTKINSNQHRIKVFSESFVLSTYLPMLREKYNKTSYKTEKSSAISMLRVTHEEEDYKYLYSLAFGAEGIDARTRSELLDTLEGYGFMTVPYVVLEPEEIPKDFDEFVKWLDDFMISFYRETTMFPSDGMVIDVNRLDYNDEVKAQYSNRNFALKLGCWGFDRYYGTVEEVVLEQQRVYKSCRLKITPTFTKDGCEAKYVNCYNPRILIENDILPGATVPFERNSGAINTLIRGDRRIKLT